MECSVKPRGSIEQKTKPIELVETKLGKGIRWSGGGDLKSKAKMMGVWFRGNYAGKMIGEHSQPSTLPEREDW